MHTDDRLRQALLMLVGILLVCIFPSLLHTFIGSTFFQFYSLTSKQHEGNHISIYLYFSSNVITIFLHTHLTGVGLNLPEKKYHPDREIFYKKRERGPVRGGWVATHSEH